MRCDAKYTVYFLVFGGNEAVTGAWHFLVSAVVFKFIHLCVLGDKGIYFEDELMMSNFQLERRSSNPNTLALDSWSDFFHSLIASILI